MCQFKQNQIILLRERESVRVIKSEREREFRCFVPFFRQKNRECLCKIVLGEIQISELVENGENRKKCE